MCAHTSPGVARVSEGAFSLLLPPTWQGQNINNDRCIIICAVARLRSIWCSRRCAARPRSWARPVGRGRTFSVHFSIYFYTHFLCTFSLSLSIYIYIYIFVYTFVLYIFLYAFYTFLYIIAMRVLGWGLFLCSGAALCWRESRREVGTGGRSGREGVSEAS